MTLWYFETRSPMGHWAPNTAPDQPQTATHDGNLHLHRTGGRGPRVRAVQAVAEEHAALKLRDLRDIYGPDHNQSQR